VALKIIKPGMDSRQVIARFEAELQALSLMDHPNIAKVFDAGTTEGGRPYFVMELVKGQPITQYCDEKHLTPRQRLELLLPVCQAIQHAHQKGIIHRDIKPSNVLVTLHDGVPVPKVIDFGVAKATQSQRLTDLTLFTQFEQMIGTPLYMSPEQAEMTSLDIDTRSDIYSLGVLLYELLTGRTPIDTATMAQAGMDEIRRLIREVDPPRPSARVKTLDGNELTTAAKRRHTDPSHLPKSLRGDIDWIVMKCLEKDRKRRYETANGLAADLQRHLRNEVVIARPPTAAYLLGKLIKRNKMAFVAAAAIAASLAAGMGATVWQLAQTRRALSDLRATAPAFVEQARALAAKERFDEAIEKVNYAINLQPEMVDYLVAKGDLLQCQLKLPAAAAAYREALRVKPGHARAEASAKLCDELLAAKPTDDGKLTRESLARLHVAMQQQQRPAVELMPVARLLGEENKLLVDYWLARLKDLPVSGERPLEDRLTVRDDGKLALDLSGTKVVDLAPLADAPLAVLNLSGCAELNDISPLRDLHLVGLILSGTAVADLSPLAEMRALEKLNISDTYVTDLSPIKALRLKTLSAARCAISDLAPIRGMPLEELTLFETRVADITPLSGMPIKVLDLSMCPVLDFAPLATLPLEKCYLQRNRITDLLVFRGKSLKELVLLGCAEARNYSVLSEIPTLELLLIPSEYRRLPWEDYSAIGALRRHPKLRQLGAEVMGGMGYSATGPKDVFWQDWDREQSFVLALRERNITFGLRKLATGTYSLGMENQAALTNLSVIKGAPISVLNMPRCKFTDLTPLRGMPLRILQMSENEVRDLSPLQGMPLEELYLRQTKVTDLSPLAGMPLKRLFLDGCSGVADVKVLGTIESLQHLTIPPGADNIESLRSLPNLRKLAYHVEAAAYHPITTVEQFWKEHDEQGWLKQLRACGFPPKFVKRHADGTWEVRLNETGIADLRILSGAPISRLWLGKTRVADLAPLRGMALKELKLDGTNVTDLRPLDGMPIETLSLNGAKVADISALRRMPLTSIRLHNCAELRDLTPIADAKALTTITLPPNAKDIEFLRAFPKLQSISFEESAAGVPDKSATDFWKEYDTADWLRKLQAARFRPAQAKRLPDGTWDLNFRRVPISSLELLRGAPVSKLHLGNTAVTDLAPLRGMPLKHLIVYGTKVVDLRPLKGMPLEYLHAGDSKVDDISVLRGMPLQSLWLHNCPVTDISPLAEAKGLRH
jgi:Leucine-rich repeat (LRR) protein